MRLVGIIDALTGLFTIFLPSEVYLTSIWLFIEFCKPYELSKEETPKFWKPLFPNYWVLKF